MGQRLCWGQGGDPTEEAMVGKEASDAPAPLCKRPEAGSQGGVWMGRNLLGATSEEGSATGILGRAGQGGWKRAVIEYLLPHCSEPHSCLFACSKPPGGRGTGWGEAPGGGGRGQRRAGSLSQASSRCKMS